MQDPPTDPTGEQFREAFTRFAAAPPSSHEIMPGTPNTGMNSGGTVPSDRSEHQREPAWPEIPPAWPEVPPASSFTPSVRSFVEGAPPQAAEATVRMPGPVAGRQQDTGPQGGHGQGGHAQGGHGQGGFGPGFPPGDFGQGGFGPGSHGPGSFEQGNSGQGGFGSGGLGPTDPGGLTMPGSPGHPQGSPFPGAPQSPQPHPSAMPNGLQNGGGPQRFPSAAPNGVPGAAFDAGGFNAGGANGGGFGRPGSDGPGFDRAGFDGAGFDRAGFDRAGFDGAGGPRPGDTGQPRQSPGGAPFTPSVRSYAESAPPSHTAPPPPPSAPDDPYRPFVTAGQISGPKTPPAHRQQELWNTVFGENYRAIDEYEDEPGRPVWLYALVASVVAALVGVLVWAFTAGPFTSGESAEAAAATPRPSASASESAAAAKPQAQVPPLPVYKGTASPVIGVVTDSAAGITLPRLGGPWQADTNAAQVKATYGFTSRQYVPAGMTTKGKREFAQVMSGRLAQSLAVKYTTPDNLGPVVSAVMFRARQTQFPKDNKATKVAQQKISRNGLTGLLAAYKVTADGGTTTVVVAAVNTGADLPTIVYMAVPELKNDLLPDINTVVKSIKPVR